MKTSRLIIFALIVGLPVSGCSGTIFKQFSIDNSPATSISLDARQRLIFVTEKGGPVPEKDGVPVQQHRIICAEPSPDAFMALVAAGGADLTMGKKEIGAYGSMAESVGALGRRTQTVQLLRDVLYRACEAYMNGVIDKNEYRRIMVAYDELVITLAAIESLGRSIAEPFPPLVGGKASVNETKDTAASDSSAGAGAASSDKPSAKTASAIGSPASESISDIVRNYYCFQIGLKQMLYDRKGELLNSDVIKALCEHD